MEKQILTREELYKLVWATPLTTLAAKYKVSYSQLRAICHEYAIPLPKMGYWSKKKHSKPVQVTALPRTKEKSVKIELIPNPKLINPKTEARHPKDLPKFNTDQNSTIKVPTYLIHPDKLIVEARRDLTRNRHPYRGLINTYSGQLSIRVAPHNIHRALLILDTFVKMLKAKRHIIKSDSRDVWAEISGQQMDFSLREGLKVTRDLDEMQNRFNVYHPTNLLILKIGRYGPTEFRDDKIPLEDQLSSIVQWMEETALLKNKKEAEWQIEKKKIEEEKRLKEEARRIREQENAEFSAFIDQALRWQQANTLREFLKAKIANQSSGIDSGEISWLERRISALDPLMK